MPPIMPQIVVIDNWPSAHHACDKSVLRLVLSSGFTVHRIDISGSVAISASELTWAYAELSFEDFAERAGIVESPTEGYIRNRIF